MVIPSSVKILLILLFTITDDRCSKKKTMITYFNLCKLLAQRSNLEPLKGLERAQFPGEIWKIGVKTPFKCWDVEAKRIGMQAAVYITIIRIETGDYLPT